MQTHIGVLLLTQEIIIYTGNYFFTYHYLRKVGGKGSSKTNRHLFIHMQTHIGVLLFTQDGGDRVCVCVCVCVRVCGRERVCVCYI